MAEMAGNGVTVGIAFLPKKLPRVLTRELQRLAENLRLHLVALDPHAPLEGQEERREDAAADSNGPCTAAFDVITHKLHDNPDWEVNLSHYLSLRPHVRLLDSPAAIHMTEDRALMLSAIPPAGLELRLQLGPGAGQQPPSEARAAAVAGTALPGSENGAWGCTAEPVAVRVLSPPQAVVSSQEELLALAEEGGHQGLQPPLIIKTRRTDAAGGSGHGLAVALTWGEMADKAEALQGTACTGAGPAGGGGGSSGGGGGWVPLVVQQYVPHSEALYKVYVLGRQIRVVRRASLTLQQLRAMAPDAPPSPPPPKRPKQQPELQQQQQQQQQQHQQQRLVKEQEEEEGRKQQDPALAQEEEEVAAQPRGSPRAVPPEGAPGAVRAPGPGPGGFVLRNFSAQPQTTAGDTGTGTGSDPTGAAPAGAVHVVDGSGGSPGAWGPSREHDAMPAGLLPPSAHPSASGGAEGAPPVAAAAAAAAASACRGMLDERLLGAVARELSRRMALSLFNFDVVVPELGPPAEEHVPGPQGEPRPPEAAARAGRAGVEEGGAAGPDQRAGAAPGAGEVLLYVVDVNYFPGYDKLPGWEALLVEHLRTVADEVVAARGGGGRGTA